MFSVMLSILYTCVFYSALFFICRYFLTRSNGVSAVAQSPDTGSCVKYDWAIAFSVYFLFTLLYFYPCLSSMGSSLIGPPEDNMEHFWTMWWMRQVASEPQAHLSYSRFIYYPQGTWLLYHAYSFYNLFFSLPLAKIFNPVAAYNVLVLHSFIVSGLGAFLLIRYLVKSSLVALIGGFIFAFNPSHCAHSLHHIGEMSIQFIPFFVLFFIKALKNNSRKDLIFACIFFLLSSLCSFYHFLFSAVFIVLGYGYLALKKKRIFLKTTLVRSAIVIGFTTLVLSPWILKMAQIRGRYPGIETYEGVNIYVADLLGFIVPHPFHLAGGLKALRNLNAQLSGNDWEKTAYLGIVNIAIILFAFKRTARAAAKYFLGLFSFMIVAMGALVHVAGKAIPVYLPYYAFQFIPFISVARTPSRAIVYAYLFLAIIVAFSLKRIHEAMKTSSARRIVFIALSVFLFLDYFSVCRSVTPVQLPQCYGVIQKGREEFGILDMPGYYCANERYMMYQTLHGIPIVQGNVSRRANKSLIDVLELNDLAAQKQQLIENKVKYIVVHKDLFMHSNASTQTQHAQWLEAVKYRTRQFYLLVYEDERNIVFKVY